MEIYWLDRSLLINVIGTDIVFSADADGINWQVLFVAYGYLLMLSVSNQAGTLKYVHSHLRGFVIISQTESAKPFLSYTISVSVYFEIKTEMA